MVIKILCIGKTNVPYLNEGITDYQKRTSHYINIDFHIIPDVKNAKNLSVKELKEKEADLILKNIEKSDNVILLDEKGRNFSSKEFSEYIQQKINSNVKRLIFVIGGAYGFSEALYERFPESISISKMTFSHQMIRLLFIEQIYRAFTILKGEPYHNE